MQEFAFIPAPSPAVATHAYHVRTGTIGPIDAFGSDCVLPLVSILARDEDLSREEIFMGALWTLCHRRKADNDGSDAAFDRALTAIQATINAFFGEDPHANEIGDAMAGHP